ncbi:MULTISPECIES: hypothetical protein [unclassified Rhodanobacter]|uniref:hypothetical protein n=1 Tax=unclassified Rhodanobacter TaxID=2621553 RepID=UPI0034E45D96
MTQKYTAEEVRANIAANRRYMTTETELQLTAYADTLSKPADIGRVGDEDLWRAVDRMIVDAWKIGGCKGTLDMLAMRKRYDEAAALALALALALAAQGQGDAVAYFSADPAEGEFSTHKSLAEAVAAAASLLAFAQDVASDDGWADEPPQICYGVVLGRCVEKEGSRRPAPEGSDFSEMVDFRLTEPSATAAPPASPAGVPDGLYRNACDSVESWKARALKAEDTAERLVEAMNDLTGPTFMGEPVLPKPAKHCDRGPDDCVQCSVLAGTFAVKSAAPSAPEDDGERKPQATDFTDSQWEDFER